jgi:hypothetical protein
MNSPRLIVIVSSGQRVERRAMRAGETARHRIELEFAEI